MSALQCIDDMQDRMGLAIASTADASFYLLPLSGPTDQSTSECGGTMLLLLLLMSLTSELAEGVIGRAESCKIHPNHTLCLHQDFVNPECGEIVQRGLTPEERVLVTRLHNERRSFIARGLEKRGDPGPQPPAANMMQLTYDEELELEAQTWSDQCVRGHDCPDCRTLPRFLVGQNLFWYGHFVGSWEKSIAGWYDEVADFNSSFVYPFYVIPGVLVGHFTQMTWAQSTKIGCGKLFAQPANSTLGQQFYICNYGLAGNLVKSEMYSAGVPCSACPEGTSCSEEHPGLCQGVPVRPLTIRPPIRDHINFPTHGSGKSENNGPVTVLQLPPIEVATPPPLSGSRDECMYECEANGGCSVRYSSATGFFSGSVLGSCFPPSFGGKCTGTPDKCKECSGVCRGQQGKRITIALDEKGNPSQPQVSPLTKEEENDSEITCSYSCNARGGCSVRVNSGRRPVSGSVLGSCFSKDFGGKCSGIPEACVDCSEVCVGKGEQEFVLPAKST